MNVVRWGMIGCGSVAERKSGPAFYKAPGSALVAVMGGLCVANGANNGLGLNTVPGTTLSSACNPDSVPLGDTSLQVHDAVDQAQVPFLNVFPYLNTPIPGAVN